MLILQLANLQQFFVSATQPSDLNPHRLTVIRMPDKPHQLVLKYKFWIETDTGVNILGEGKWKLLKAIRDTGSLKAAFEKMGYTYRQTWENLKSIEEKLGFKLIEKHRGGENGGQTMLTSKGERFIELFDKLYNEAEPDIHRTF
jgi:molybdate transport system regulatory protein